MWSVIVGYQDSGFYPDRLLCGGSTLEMRPESCDWYLWDSTGEPRGQSEVLSLQNQVFYTQVN